MKARFFFYTTVVCVFAAVLAAGQTVTPDTPAFSLKKGESKDIKFTLTGGTTLVATPASGTCCSGAVSVRQKSASGNEAILTFTGDASLPQRTPVQLNFTVDGAAPAQSTVTVSVIDPAQFQLSRTTIPSAVQDKREEIRLTVPGTTIENDRVKFDGFGSNGAQYANGIITLTPTVTGLFNVNVKVDGVTVGTSAVTVGDAVKLQANVSTVTLKQGAPIDLASLGLRLLAKDGVTDLTSTRCATPTIMPLDPGVIADPANPGKFKVNPGLAASSTTEFDVSCAGVSTKIKVNVEAAPSRIKFEPPAATIYLNSPTLIEATIIGADDEPITGDAGRVEWFFKDDAAAIGVRTKADYAALIDLNESGNRIRVQLRSMPANNKPLYVYARSVYGGVEGQIMLTPEKTREVTDFTMIKIDLEVMEDKTTKDNFGQELMKNYFVTKATVHNTAQDDKGVFYNSPILVYNQSIEAKALIAYEDPDTGKWITATEEQRIPSIKRTTNNNETDLRAEWTGILTALDKTRTTEFLSIPHRVTDLKKCSIREQIDYMYPIQPMKYETALMSHESRENNSWKHRLLTAMLSLSTLTAVVTNIVGAGGDWPLGQTQFTNLLVPGFQKYFPDRREIHKDHLVQQLMQPLLEIPFGSQETKYILFPRSPINVSIPLRRWNSTTNKWDVKTIKRIKIVGLSPSDTCANVAVIKKTP
jgi:hypothetical protein